ncbi:hydrolase [Streptomyces sp. DSM 44915]|uniref:Hydrolase n=1 Tax=Streptomyces chisholmiae TaxID=3075540 RepID=A0ABU2JN01_9ACTN|nr:hydrolase [Streptomyces sp. DSM 44915]MDT0266370.1 hydrolase [Streptomyces sp. DSM 44915]
MTSDPTQPFTPPAPAPAPAPARRARRAPRALALAAALVAAGAGTALGGPAAGASPAPERATAECAVDGFCEDFEGLPVGEPSGRWAVEARDCSGTGTATVAAGTGRDGGQALRIDGADGYCNHVFAATELADVATSTGLYVRFWVRHTTELPAQHVTFLALEDVADNSRDLRMGGQNGALQWNRESDDATLPAQSPAGVALSAPLPVTEWSCVEFALDGPNGLLETWLDGELVEGLVVDGEPTHDVDQQWLSRGAWAPEVVDLRLGWESYGQGADTLWYDDLAVGTTRTGC